METLDYNKYQRRAPRQLTNLTEINATTTIMPGLPDSKPMSMGFLRGIKKAILATAFFRSWHFILMFTIEATIVTYFYESRGHAELAISNTLMNVLGTVLGFVIRSSLVSMDSELTTDNENFTVIVALPVSTDTMRAVDTGKASSHQPSDESHKNNRSQVVYNVRMFARTVWYHVPNVPGGAVQMAPAKNMQEYKARMLVEKKTVLNLLEAFAAALKHYLRGEESHFYEDVFSLVKFLPAYSLPAGTDVQFSAHKKRKQTPQVPLMPTPKNEGFLPLPVTDKGRTPTFTVLPPDDNGPGKGSQSTAAEESDTIYLLPSRNPPRWHIFDMWPLYLFIRAIQKNGKELRGKRALRDRARNQGSGDNLPLEITHYLTSYIASLQHRGVDGFTIAQMAGALSQLVDALTGLERILTTPVPWAYQVHLWTVTLVWLLALPFQVLSTLGWLTIPGVALAAFVYCGLMKCAEELENPFGYDFNDLNLDHFTHNIIRKELQAMTALPMPDPMKWAFTLDNDAVFDTQGNAIYVDQDSFGVTDMGSMRRPSETVSASPMSINAKSPSSGAGLSHDGSGNAAIGGAGGAGLVAGSAISAGALSSSPPSN